MDDGMYNSCLVGMWSYGPRGMHDRTLDRVQSCVGIGKMGLKFSYPDPTRRLEQDEDIKGDDNYMLVCDTHEVENPTITV